MQGNECCSYTEGGQLKIKSYWLRIDIQMKNERKTYFAVCGLLLLFGYFGFVTIIFIENNLCFQIVGKKFAPV